MLYIEAQGRNQKMMCWLDSVVDPEGISRVIDRFADGFLVIDNVVYPICCSKCIDGDLYNGFCRCMGR